MNRCIHEDMCPACLYKVAMFDVFSTKCIRSLLFFVPGPEAAAPGLCHAVLDMMTVVSDSSKYALIKVISEVIPQGSCNCTKSA